MTILNRFNMTYFFSVPPETQIIWFWLACFAALLVATFVIYFVLRARGSKETPYKRFAKNFFWPNLLFSIFGLILTFSRYEKLALFSYRFWVYLTILVVITFNSWYFIVKRGQLDDELLVFHNNARKNKWLKPHKK